jgi:hypothetical protein
MGFERQRGSEQSLGRAARRGGNAVRMVGILKQKVTQQIEVQ